MPATCLLPRRFYAAAITPTLMMASAMRCARCRRRYDIDAACRYADDADDAILLPDDT